MGNIQQGYQNLEDGPFDMMKKLNKTVEKDTKLYR
jgi:hypothetical protein